MYMNLSEKKIFLYILFLIWVTFEYLSTIDSNCTFFWSSCPLKLLSCMESNRFSPYPGKGEEGDDGLETNRARIYTVCNTPLNSTGWRVSSNLASVMAPMAPPPWHERKDGRFRRGVLIDFPDLLRWRWRLILDYSHSWATSSGPTESSEGNSLKPGA